METLRLRLSREEDNSLESPSSAVTAESSNITSSESQARAIPLRTLASSDADDSDDEDQESKVIKRRKLEIQYIKMRREFLNLELAAAERDRSYQNQYLEKLEKIHKKHASSVQLLNTEMKDAIVELKDAIKLSVDNSQYVLHALFYRQQQMMSHMMGYMNSMSGAYVTSMFPPPRPPPSFQFNQQAPPPPPQSQPQPQPQKSQQQQSQYQNMSPQQILQQHLQQKQQRQQEQQQENEQQ